MELMRPEFQAIKSLMARQAYPFSLPKGFFALKIIESRSRQNESNFQIADRDQLKKNEEEVIRSYVRHRFYNITETKFNFWILIY